MSSTLDIEPDIAVAYEALVEFLYLAPIGILKFRPTGTIDMANPTAAALLMPLALDGEMSNLYRLLASIAPDLQRHVQRFRELAGPIFTEMKLFVPSTRNTLMLDINKINATTLMAVVQNVSDLTEARRETARKTESQRLLASVFMRLNTPVVVNRADGMILLSNTAFQTLLGYDADSLAGLNIDALLPVDAHGVARAARTQQMQDGKSYQLDIEVVTKAGVRLHLGLHSALLHESDAKQLRVVTLLQGEGRALSAGQASHPQEHDKFAGFDLTATQVKTISLSQFSTVIGSDWAGISARAMILVEAAIKPMFGKTDIVKRSKDNSFIIWFSDGDPVQNAAVLARAEQAVRRVFITEFGAKVAQQVMGAVAA